MFAFTDRLDDIDGGRADPTIVLAEMTFVDLASVVEARFPREGLADLEHLGHGRSRRAGDVCGVLAMSREVAERLHELAVPYVYAVEHGDTRDFIALKNCVGFLTTNPAPTAFAPVQAVSEDHPTLVGLSATEHTEPAEHRLLTVDSDGVPHSLGSHPRRWLGFAGANGGGACSTKAAGCVCRERVRSFTGAS